jgi:hypothetical protein
MMSQGLRQNRRRCLRIPTWATQARRGPNNASSPAPAGLLFTRYPKVKPHDPQSAGLADLKNLLVHRFRGGEDQIVMVGHGKALPLKEEDRRQRATALDNGQRSPRSGLGPASPKKSFS